MVVGDHVTAFNQDTAAGSYGVSMKATDGAIRVYTSADDAPTMESGASVGLGVAVGVGASVAVGAGVCVDAGPLPPVQETAIDRAAAAADNVKYPIRRIIPIGKIPPSIYFRTHSRRTQYTFA